MILLLPFTLLLLGECHLINSTAKNEYNHGCDANYNKSSNLNVQSISLKTLCEVIRTSDIYIRPEKYLISNLAYKNKIMYLQSMLIEEHLL